MNFKINMDEKLFEFKKSRSFILQWLRENVASLSQAKLAKQINVSNGTIAAYETRDVTPGDKHLVMLLVFYQISRSSFYLLIEKYMEDKEVDLHVLYERCKMKKDISSFLSEDEPEEDYAYTYIYIPKHVMHVKISS